ncbi:MAG: FkbM family methyltransferase [Steroidobacteraceae bacterium]
MKTPDLVFDVGAHHGSDTAHYLSLGYRVLAIEADPAIVATLRHKFADAIAADRLVVLECGIANKEGDLPFYVCPGNTEWNSFDKEWARARGMEAIETSVKARRFESVLKEYGTPLFAKIDIEGCDGLCINAFTKDNAPQFVSFEAGAHDFDLISHLYSIGYRRFALVNQYSFETTKIPSIGIPKHLAWSMKQIGRQFVRTHPIAHRIARTLRPRLRFNNKAGGFSHDSAGPSPMERKEGWQEVDEFVYTWTSVVLSGILTSAWFDIHAAL